MDIIAENVRKQNKPWSRTIFIQQPHTSTRTLLRKREQFTFRINIRQLLSCGFDITRRHLKNSQLGHWAKVTKDGLLVFRLFNNTVALVTLAKAGDEILLWISCEKGTGRFYLAVYPKNHSPPVTTEVWFEYVSGLLSEVKPDYPLAITRKGWYLSSIGRRVAALFKKRILNRQFFDIELAIEDSNNEQLGAPGGLIIYDIFGLESQECRGD